ncbi:hypothetical protein ACNTMW_29990 [Planosporangium sp. 12N6]|uniref:hypothetical protein n=1 Tax=Planosporangium spinosum TaxID=3402278 RepID=UPI003CF995E6
MDEFAGGPDGDQPRRIDRRRDLAVWVVTPLVTLLLGPVIAFCVSGAALGAARGTPPSIDCTSHIYRDENVNRGHIPDGKGAYRIQRDCYGAETSIIRRYAAAFLVGWVLLWLLPWWRGLRRVRLLLAVVTVLPLVLLPVRLFLGMPDEW